MAESDLLADLNEAQREAVTCIDGPVLILAGPGSGKTRVITRRVAYLLELGVHPGNILAITFTNKAADEMRQRVEALRPGNRVWISTFHALGARLLRRYADRLGLDPNFTIYDQTDRASLVKKAMEGTEIKPQRFTPESVMNAISWAKNHLLSPERYAHQARDFFSLTVAKVYLIYEKLLRKVNALDFDDLLYWPAMVLKNDPELRSELDSRFKYILIDEYQDTNQAQYQIARRLSINYPNLCVVGDPDQSIYKFRGSDIRNILKFEEDFPQAKTLTLSLNYRSTKSILTAASGLIAHNRQRKHKKLLTENDLGCKVGLLSFHSGSDEVSGIAQWIAAAVRNGKRRYRDFAVLVRMNALTRGLEQAMIRERVPFQIVRGLAFFDRKENRDVLAYLRLLVNPKDDISFERIVNEPPRGIGATTLASLKLYAEKNELSLFSACGKADMIAGLRGKGAKALLDFHATIVSLTEYLKAQPDELIRQVLDRTGYRKMLKERSDEEDLQRLANIEELITAAGQFAQADNTATIQDWLESIALSSDVDALNEKQDSVAIMTMHAAKGLEFPVVFLMAVEQGILPHQRSIKSDKEEGEEIEEERRLMFVGMTRAKEELYLTRACNLREFRGQHFYPIKSRFLDEIPPHVVEKFDQTGSVNRNFDDYRSGSEASQVGWREAGIDYPVPSRPRPDDPFPIGALVNHPEHGQGQILGYEGSRATRTVCVRFQRAGERKFRLSHVSLELLQGD